MSQAFWDQRYWASDYWSYHFWETELPTNTGSIAAPGGNASAEIVGGFNAFSTNTGDIAATLGNATAALAGTNSVISLARGFWHPQYWADDYFDQRYWNDVPGSTATGTIAQTLTLVTAQISALYIPSGASNGNIATQLDDFSAELHADQYTLVWIDLPLSFTTIWAIEDLPAVSASIAVTLAPFTAALIGDFQVADQRNGTIATTLASTACAWAGTNIAPASRTGVITTTLESVVPAINGIIGAPADFGGEIRAVLEDWPAHLAATHVAPHATGNLIGDLQHTQLLVQGVFIPAGAFLGTFSATVADVTAQLTGEFLVPLRTGAIVASLDDVTALADGVFVPIGGSLGVVDADVINVAALLTGNVFSPAHVAPATVDVVVRSIDSQTLAEQYNIGLAQVPDYEFSNGRTFFQRTGT